MTVSKPDYMNEYLSKDQVEGYLKSRNIYDHSAVLTVKDLHAEKESIDGYVNQIYHIRDQKGKSVILKQIVNYPRFRAEEEKKYGESKDMGSVTFDTARMRNEIAVLIFWNTIDPGICPDVYLFDEAHSVIVMEDLIDLSLLRYDNCRMIKHKTVGDDLGRFFGKNLFYSSDLHLTNYKKKELELFFKNPEYDALADSVFHTSIIANEEREMVPGAEKLRRRVIANPGVQAELKRLENMFYHYGECLIHTDLHASNVMVGHGKTKIIDTEFAGFGPIAQDVGRICASLVLNYLSWYGDDNYTEGEKAVFRDYLLTTMEALYKAFDTTFKEMVAEHSSDSYILQNLNVTDYCKTHIRDSISYTVLNVASRTAIAGMCYDFERLPKNSRLYPSLLVLKLAEDIFPNIDDYTTIASFTDKLRVHAFYNPLESLIDG